MRKIILASASPRRRELLAAAGVIFQVCAADGEEKITSDKPEEIVRELSEQKATAVALNFDMEEGTVVIGADTIVSYNNEILGKPVDESDAFKTLKMLQGNIHQVYTGVTVLIRKMENGRISHFLRVQMFLSTRSPMRKSELILRVVNQWTKPEAMVFRADLAFM